MPEIVGRLRTPRLAGAPASPVVGEVYYDTTTNILYWWNGTTWISASGGGAGGGVDYIGDWAAGTTYKQGDVVRYAGVDYIAVNPSTNQAPTVPTQSPSQIQGLVPIERKLLAAPAANFDFQNIPQYFSQLMLVIQARGTDAAGQITNNIRFNNDATAGNYGAEYITGYASTVSANENIPSGGYTSGYFGNLPAAGAPANLAGGFEIMIPNYVGTSFHKMYISKGGNRNGTATTTERIDHAVGHWLSTAAINRITIFPNAGNYAAGSVATLYGVLDTPMLTAGNVSGQIGTAFPTSPVDGQRFTLVDSLTAPTFAWECRYVAGITDAYKWLVIGGDAKMVRVDTVYPTNAALSMSVPRPGYYNLGQGHTTYSAVMDAVLASYLTADGAGSWAYGSWRSVGNAGGVYTVESESPNVLVLATLLQVTSANSSGNYIDRRWIKAMPVRLS